jgi:hypothetical protein
MYSYFLVTAHVSKAVANVSYVAASAQAFAESAGTNMSKGKGKGKRDDNAGTLDVRLSDNTS